MGLLSEDGVTQVAFSVFQNKGVFAVLLGSGVSRAASIPTGWEITLDLIRKIALTRGIPEQADWADWFWSQTKTEANYSTVIEELALSPSERRSILAGYIEPSEEDREQKKKIPTRAHLAVADLVRSGYVRVIITTNFDRLMENALREREIEPTIVTSIDSLAGAEPMVHSKCFVLKLHGDYKDARIRNTGLELQSYPKPINKLLDRIFDEYGLIVAGWSGQWDEALRAAWLRAPNRRYPSYFASRSPPTGATLELTNHRHAKLIPIADADTFFGELRDRVETLATTNAQDPLSIELLVNTAKRFLAKEECRIPLEELCTKELERLLAILATLAVASPVSSDLFRERITAYESAAEPLTRVAGVLGRWGEDWTLPLVLNVIRTIVARPQLGQSGMVIWLDIRAYAAVLIFTSYGLGLAHSSRWSVLQEILSAPLNVGGEEKRLVETLFLGSWIGGKTEYWHQISGLERRHTPLSDHLCALMAQYSRSFIGIVPDFELLFERFELLASLAYLQNTRPEDFEAAFAATSFHNFIWSPVGRVIWDRDRRVRLLKELESQEFRNLLRASGFHAGNANLFTHFARNFEAMARTVR
jgi:SIR2-like domain